MTEDVPDDIGKDGERQTVAVARPHIHGAPVLCRVVKKSAVGVMHGGVLVEHIYCAPLRCPVRYDRWQQEREERMTKEGGDIV